MEYVVAFVIAAAAVAAVVYPLLRGEGAGVPLDAEEAQDSPPVDVEAEVSRYRAALRGGTLCARCGRANPQDSRFCAECGRRLEGRRARRRPRSPAA